MKLIIINRLTNEVRICEAGDRLPPDDSCQWDVVEAYEAYGLGIAFAVKRMAVLLTQLGVSK